VADLKIGVFVEGFKLPARQAIVKARDVGAHGFQFYATRGEFHPDNFAASARRDFRKFVDSLGLEVSALCADFGLGYTNPETVDQVVSDTKKVLALARDLDVTITTTHIGVVPDQDSSPTWELMTEAVREVAEFAAGLDSCLATETGPETGKLLARFIKAVGSEGLKVNFDPANFVMAGFDHLQAVEDLAPYIVHTHAKDGISPASGGPKEVPLGEGEVKWDEYLARLAEIGYHGYFTIEREVGENPEADIRSAVRFLKGF